MLRDLAQRARATRDVALERRLRFVEFRGPRLRLDEFVHGGRQCGERRIERAFHRRAPAHAVRHADRLYVACEDRQRVGRVAHGPRARGLRDVRFAVRDERRDARQRRGRQRGDPCAVFLVRERAAKEPGQVVGRRQRREHFRGDALGQFLEERVRARQSGLAQEADRVHVAQCVAHQCAHRGLPVGVALEHLQEEPHARGR